MNAFDPVAFAARYPEKEQKLLKVLQNAQLSVSEDEGYAPPAKTFEEHYNLTGISAHWKMPEGYNEQTMERKLSTILDLPIAIEQVKNKYFLDRKTYHALKDAKVQSMRDAQQFMSSMWEEVKRLNPELAGINIDANKAPQDVHDALCGVASQFNKDDIAFYLEDKKSGERLRREPAYMVLRATVGDATAFGWIPSPQTLQKMHTQLQGRILVDDRSHAIRFLEKQANSKLQGIG